MSVFSRGDGTGVGHRAARGPTRISWAWVTVVGALVLGVALLDFLVQNTQSTRIEFFAASGRVPVSLALFAAALAGSAVVIVIGVARMIQLRRGLSARKPADEEDGVARSAQGDATDR